MTVTAFIVAISIARSLEAFKWLLIAGILLDLMREAIDRILGRPSAAVLENISVWKNDEGLMRKVQLLVYGSIGGWLIFTSFIGFAYSSSIAAGRPVILHDAFTVVGRTLPDLSLLENPKTVELFRAPSSNSPASLELSHNFVSLITLATIIYVFLGAIFLSRPLSIISAAWARKRGAKSYPDQAVVVAMYFFLLLLAISDAYLYNDIGHFSCVTNSECSRSARVFALYSHMTGFLAPMLVAMASTAESGCLERISMPDKT